MLDHDLRPQTRESALTTLLASHPDAIVAALEHRGFRIPLPDSFAIGDHHALEVPREPTTMLSVVMPANRIAVVAAWERARKNGLGVTNVRALWDPETSLTLGIVDARELYGVWLAVLTHAGDGSSAALDELDPQVVPSRPRQATMHKNMTAFITEVDANVTKMLGWTAEQLVGFRSSEFIHPEDQDRAVAAFMHLLSTMVSQRVRVRHRCSDGGWLWVELENIHNRSEDPDEVDVTTLISDISDEMAAYEALRRREQLFSRLAEALPTGVLQLGRDGSVVYANARLSAVLSTGAPSTLTELLVNVVSADRPAVQAAVDAALGGSIDSELEVEIRPPRAVRSRRCALTVAAVDDHDGQPGALICVSDVTESVRLREELTIQATHDPLTGCLNRSAVIDALERLLSDPDSGASAAVFIDIDNFKPVNDRLGHASGDELLIHVAHRLQGLCREEDRVARLGGDEFLLVCRDSGLPDAVAALSGRVRGVFKDSFALPTTTVELRASIGVAWPEADTTAEKLIRQADAAMYESKRRRDGEPVLFADIAARPEPIRTLGTGNPPAAQSEQSGVGSRR
jgi:diguanylate cyclase (GGDEF)-like protein/PAS domain S-box-containing protein